MHYLEVANSPFVFGIAALIIGVVLLSTLLFMRMAWKQGIAIGMDKKLLLNTMKSSAVLSVGPTIPIIIALLVMFPILGVPWPWLRLSVIGSAPYELMTAEVGATSMGVAGLGAAGYSAQVFANSILLMAILPLDVLFFNVFFLKKYSKKLETVRDKDPVWMEIFSYCLFMGLLGSFAGGILIKGPVEILTFGTALVFAIGIGLTIKKFDAKWLKNYALVFSMIGGMVLSILYTGMF